VAKKSDLVAAAARRYQRAVEAHAAALARGDEKAIAKASKDVEEARKRLEALVSTARPLIGAAGGGALGGAFGAVLGGPVGAAIGGGLGAAGGGYLTTTTSPQESKASRGEGAFGSTVTAKEIRQLKKKLLR
jgi:hypothetical protein